MIKVKVGVVKVIDDPASGMERRTIERMPRALHQHHIRINRRQKPGRDVLSPSPCSLATSGTADSWVEHGVEGVDGDRDHHDDD